SAVMRVEEKKGRRGLGQVLPQVGAGELAREDLLLLDRCLSQQKHPREALREGKALFNGFDPADSQLWPGLEAITNHIDIVSFVARKAREVVIETRHRPIHQEPG